MRGIEGRVHSPRQKTNLLHARRGRYGSKVDTATIRRDVRFTPNGHWAHHVSIRLAVYESTPESRRDLTMTAAAN
jgi:hypothetical protein